MEGLGGAGGTRAGRRRWGKGRISSCPHPPCAYVPGRAIPAPCPLLEQDEPAFPEYDPWPYCRPELSSAASFVICSVKPTSADSTHISVICTLRLERHCARVDNKLLLWLDMPAT